MRPNVTPNACANNAIFSTQANIGNIPEILLGKIADTGEVLRMVKAGERPGKNSKVNRALFFTTTFQYTRGGLKDLLGL